MLLTKPGPPMKTQVLATQYSASTPRVGHGLREGPHMLCHGCRRPILPEDTRHAAYEAGVSCHQCVDETSDADKERFRERQRQIMLAKERAASEQD